MSSSAGTPAGDPCMVAEFEGMAEDAGFHDLTAHPPQMPQAAARMEHCGVPVGSAVRKGGER